MGLCPKPHHPLKRVDRNFYTDKVLARTGGGVDMMGFLGGISMGAYVAI